MIGLMRVRLGIGVGFAVAAMLAPAARAQAPDTVLLEELTWTEVRDAVRSGKTTIIVPSGGTEQNGPHMALGKHNARVRILSERIARSLGDALVAPVIAYVPEGGIAPPSGHMRFAGTISTPEDAFEKVVESAARSFKQHGFRHIVLGRHAGLTDTALTLATEPRMVRADRLRPAHDGDGVDGDPSRATAELGRAGVELIVTRTVEAIRKSIPTR